MLVIPAVAIAVVMGYAVLENTGTQQQISVNAELIEQADCLAESGFNRGLYNLLNPANAPTATAGVWPTMTSLSGGNGTTGKLTISATPPPGTASNSTYIVQAVAVVSRPGGASSKRTIAASVVLSTTYGIPNQAGGFNGNLTLPTNATVSVQGDLRTNGTLYLNAQTSVTGNIYAQALQATSGTSLLSFVQTLATDTTGLVPTAVTDYRTYSYGGATYSAKLLATDPVAGTVLGPTATNPAGIYYATARNLTLKGVTVNGTVIVKSGSLIVSGTSANTITPMVNFPAVVVDKTITVSGTAKQLTINGLAWVDLGITNTGTDNTGSKITVNGSLLIPTTPGIVSSYNGALALNYNATSASVSNFSSTTPVSNNVQVVNWSE